MRRLVLLAPPWLVGLWLLVFSDTVWRADSMRPNIHGDTLAAGWVVLGTLIVGTTLYLAAPLFGRKLLVSSVSSALVGLDEPNGMQASLGAGIVRGLTLAGLYVMTVVFAVAFG